MWRSPHLTLPARRGVCVCCELLHIGKEGSRLANEEPHGDEECESPGGGTLRVRWSNDRNNGKVSMQERTRLGHDQVLLEKLVVYVQIRKCHRHSGHRIDGSQGRRITGFVRPGLEVHGLGRANAHEDTQHFHISGPLRQRWIEAVATLFNGWKVETRRVRDRLQELRMACIGVRSRNCRVLIYEQARDRLREDM